MSLRGVHPAHLMPVSGPRAGIAVPCVFLGRTSPLSPDRRGHLPSQHLYTRARSGDLALPVVSLWGGFPVAQASGGVGRGLRSVSCTRASSAALCCCLSLAPDLVCLTRPPSFLLRVRSVLQGPKALVAAFAAVHDTGSSLPGVLTTKARSSPGVSVSAVPGHLCSRQLCRPPWFTTSAC